MLQPVNLQLAHFNVEHSAQISKDAIAAAQQTGQGQEVVQESVKRAQIVEAGLASAEAQKVKRRGEDEEQERRREEQRESLSKHPNAQEKDTDPERKSVQKSSATGFDLYA